MIGRLLRMAGRMHPMRMRKRLREKPATGQRVATRNVARFT